ncbi:MAG: CHAT domain-containing protein, partial [Planctomycetota bacterium]
MRADAICCPIRRIGTAQPPPAPAPHRLSLVFMAAAPRGADNLNYEAEEAAILTATKDVGLDLVVEESGTLDLLSACVAREQPDAIQISCHGTLEPEPGLLLEDEVGDRHFVKTTKLVSKLGARHPRLLFLSACETAEADPVLDSLARSLTRSGAPAVLGWAAPVRDVEAILFAAGLHGRLTSGEDLAHALAYARFDLAESEQLPESSDSGPRSRDWHLARLYVDSTGGGALATADGPRRLIASGRAVKTFLDTKGKKVPVAGEREFVGRRRETQTILREFHPSVEYRRAGVFVHGLGRQGNSSLAARVARRLEHTHEPIVIYRRYDGPAILAAFRDRLATPAVTEIVNRHLPEVEQEPTNLLPALTELLQGPCDQERKDTSGRVTTRPVLVVVDDFEQALEETPTGPRHGLLPHFVEPIRAVIRAFNGASTDSRLLFTSRYQFTLPDDGTDLADLLLDVPLRGMDAHESRKQATAKLRLQVERDKRRAKKLPALLTRIDRIIAAGRGNPGLQDILFSLCLENPDACDRCLEQMEEYAESGTLPAEDQARQFLENLAIGALVDLLAPGQRELLRAMTLFELPAPAPVVKLLAQHGATPAGDDGLARLIALGLCEVYEDLHDPAEPALAVNALVRPPAGTLSEDEQQTLAALVSAPLFEHWGGQKGARQRKYVQDYELTRLALLARDARVLAATAADALRLLDQQFAYQQAAAWATEIMAILNAAKLPASVDLLRTAAERCQQVGDVAASAAFRERALASIEEAAKRGETTDTVDHAATLLTHARALAEQGRPDEALGLLERAKAMLPPGRERAIVLGDIARLRANKGEVDAALQLHQERMAVYETLGDKRSRAVTLGDIARLRAAKGEVDAALRLHQEEVAVYESLGDKRSRAVTLRDVARLRKAKGEVDA